jgi:ubiquinone/menaquinone biosynthesis C-methylase UbiE
MEYNERIKNEKEHFDLLSSQAQKSSEKVERELPVVDAFQYAYKIYEPVFNKKMPHFDIEKYILDIVNDSEGETTLASLGCGTGDWEIELLKKNPDKIKIDLIEINEEILKYAKEYCQKNKLRINNIIQDVNKLKLEKEHYDFILVRSSLHHFIEFEHIFLEVSKALKTNGKFLVMGEVIGKNGHVLYYQTREKIQRIMDVLPEKYRYNHNTKKIDVSYPNIDYSLNTFEGIRCEEIYSIIQEYFEPIEQIVFDSIITFLLDFRYGPNYNLEDNFDKAIIESFVHLDSYYLECGILKPTTLFGIYEKIT